MSLIDLPVPSIPMPAISPWLFAIIPVAVVLLIGLIFGHKIIAVILGAAMIWFGPSYIPELFSYQLFNIGNIISITGLSLTFLATTFCFLSLIGERFSDLTGTLGPSWGPILLILVAFVSGYVLHTFAPGFLEQLLGSALK